MGVQKGGGGGGFRGFWGKNGGIGAGRMKMRCMVLVYMVLRRHCGGTAWTPQSLRDSSPGAGEQPGMSGRRAEGVEGSGGGGTAGER